MKLATRLSPLDERLVREYAAFVPHRVFDIHAHLVTPAANLGSHLQTQTLGLDRYLQDMQRLMPATNIDALLFGFPSRDNDRTHINSWLTAQLQSGASKGTFRGLVLTAPQDDREQVDRRLASGAFVGIKPYHVYAPGQDTSQAEIESFAPEWMWALCDAHEGLLMLHIMRDRALADPGNLATIRRLSLKYPRCRLMLAHIGRSFSYRAARDGLRQIADLGNVFVDTSAVTETDTIRKAIEVLGFERVLFGSDYPITDLRGRCVATGESFTWLYPEPESDSPAAQSPTKMTLIGIESLLCLREACEDCGLGEPEIQAIFRGNACRLLASHLEPQAAAPTVSGPQLWSEAKGVISCGAGLRSKWAELFDPESWPSYYTKCEGSTIWDFSGRKLTDFCAGAGAVVLGYSDPDVNRAVQRRVATGSYCQLLSPDDRSLAELLLELHPWAGKVRYARGGGDAMGVAVRIARAATGRSGIAFCGYHGWQDWYLAANLGNEAALDGHLLPGLTPLGVPRELRGTAVPFRYNDVASFEAALDQLDGRLAAVVMEPMRTQFPLDGFLERVRRRCHEQEAVFVFDEITSGWRFGFPGAHARLGVEPDIAVYAKAISNGFPFAAIIGRNQVMDAANPSFISSSYWTDGVGPAAALASVRKMQALKVQPAIWARGEEMQHGLRLLAARHPACKMKVWGMPSNPYMSFDLGADTPHMKTLVVRKMLARGFLTTGVALFIMHTHTSAMVQTYLSALDDSLVELDALVTSGRLKDEAGNMPTIGNFSRLT